MKMTLKVKANFNLKFRTGENRPEVRKQCIYAIDLRNGFRFSSGSMWKYILIVFLCIISIFEGNRVRHSSIHTNVV